MCIIIDNTDVDEWSSGFTLKGFIVGVTHKMFELNITTCLLISFLNFTSR